MRPSVTVLDTDPKAIQEIRAALQEIALVAAAGFDPALPVDCGRFSPNLLVIVAARSQGEPNWPTVAALAASGKRVVVVGRDAATDSRDALRAGAEAFVVSGDAAALRLAVQGGPTPKRSPARRQPRKSGGTPAPGRISARASVALA